MLRWTSQLCLRMRPVSNIVATITPASISVVAKSPFPLVSVSLTSVSCNVQRYLIGWMRETAVAEEAKARWRMVQEMEEDAGVGVFDLHTRRRIAATHMTWCEARARHALARVRKEWMRARAKAARFDSRERTMVTRRAAEEESAAAAGSSTTTVWEIRAAA